MKTESEREALLRQCEHVLPGHHRQRTLKQQLQSLASAVDETVYPDYYGQGDDLQNFEAEVAAMFGKRAAVFMPSGTMAQQIALRAWCDRSGRFTVAMHPSAHLETAEHLGYQFLHGIHRLTFGAPEVLDHRLLNLDDFKTLGSLPGVILLELPCRPHGGLLPGWDELQAISQWARDHHVAIHMDGARIWSCRAFYQKSFAEIAALFDSLYVSFYKDIGGLCGCMLLGEENFIGESRTWQRRYGGNLFTQAPFVASAQQRLQAVLPQIDRWVTRAAELADIFARCDRVRVNPAIPQVNFFQLHLEADHATLKEKHDQLAEETGIYLFGNFRPGVIPGFSMTEVHVWENALAFDESVIPSFMQRLLGE